MKTATLLVSGFVYISFTGAKKFVISELLSDYFSLPVLPPAELR